MRDRTYEYDPEIRSPTLGGSAPEPPPQDPRARRRKAGVVVVLVGVFVGGGLLAWGLLGLLDFPSGGVEVPGEHALDVEAGEHTLWIEPLANTRGTGIACSLDAPSGATVQLREPDGRHSYTVNGREGVLAWEFETAESGAHALRCEGDSALVLLGGPAAFGRMVLGLFGGFAIGAVCLVAAIALFRKAR